MERTITLPLLDAFRFLACAVRYALGRKSIAVGWTREQVRSIAPHLTSPERTVIINSIEENFHLIPQQERREWRELLDWLKDVTLECEKDPGCPELARKRNKKHRCIHRSPRHDAALEIRAGDVVLPCGKDPNCPKRNPRKNRKRKYNRQKRAV